MIISLISSFKIKINFWKVKIFIINKWNSKMADIFANRSSVTKKSNANSNFGGLGGIATADTQSRSKSNGHAQGAISRIHNMNKT